MLVNLLLYLSWVLFSLEMVTVGVMQHHLQKFHYCMEVVGIAAWVVWALNFRIHHFQDACYK